MMDLRSWLIQGWKRRIFKSEPLPMAWSQEDRERFLRHQTAIAAQLGMTLAELNHALSNFQPTLEQQAELNRQMAQARTVCGLPIGE